MIDGGRTVVALGVLLGTLVGAVPAGAASVTARGVVFDDRDGDGERDEGEPGIAGAKVSNGVQVAICDERGAYELPVDEETIIFVIKPPGWMTSTDENHIPRFYHIHKPLGSRDNAFVYPGVAPTGELPDSVDFPLRRREEPGRFRVIALADPQPYSLEEVAFYARDVVSELIGTDAAFAMSLGDLVGDDLTLFEPLNEVQGLVGIPWYNVYGNHDMNFMSPDDKHADETFERVYGPATYAFEYADVAFIVLDDVIWKGFDGYSASGRPKNGNYVGGLRDDQLLFVENYLDTVAPEKLVVLAMHIPLAGPEPHSVPQRELLMRILSSHPRTLSLSGHTHYQKHWFLGSQEGYAPTGGGEHHHYNVGTASGSWYRGAPDPVGIPNRMMSDGTPPGYAVIDFDGSSYAVHFQVAGRPADYQMNVYARDRVSTSERREIEVVANVFAASERSVVEARLGEGAAWVPMSRRERTDPFLEDIKLLEASDRPPPGRPLPKPNGSSHIWVGKLPVPGEPGGAVIEVRTTDMFGATFISRRPIIIEP